MKNVYLTFLISFISYTTFCQTITWDGEAGTPNWEDNKNWSGDVLPCTGCNVIITDSVVLQSTQKVQSVTLNNTIPISVLNIESNGKLEIISLSNSFHFNDNSRLWNNGEIDILSTGARGFNLYGNNTSAYNNGLIQIDNCADAGIYISNYSIFDNYGDILIENCLSSGISITPLAQGSSNKFVNHPNSEIIMSQMGYMAISNEGEIMNEGDITILNTSDISIFNEFSFINNVSGNITTTNSDFQGLYNSGYFVNNGEFLINQPLKHGVLNQSFFSNYGNLIITDAGEDGIFQNSSVFTNAGNGNIEIYNSQMNGISIDPLSTNFFNTGSATILIDSTVNDGIRIEGKLENEAYISVKKPYSHGVHNLDNNDSLLNKGHIEIREINSNFKFAIYNAGNDSRIHNYLAGTLEIVNTKNAIYSNDLILNDGLIRIDSTNGPDGYSNKAFENLGKLENKGDLQISRSSYIALSNQSDIINKGEITIEIAPIGLSLSSVSNSTFLNESTGLLKIDSTTINGISNNGSLTNYGEIEIRKSENRAITNISEFINFDQIDLQKCSACLVNSGKFINEALGVINTDSSNTAGIVNNNHFMNKGDINITNTSYRGIENVNNPDSLINKGNIVIKGADIGLFHNASASVFINEGFLKIDSIESNGLILSNRTINTGEIILSRCNSGLKLQLPSDTIFNSGRITLNDNIYGIYLYNTYPFINTSCGFIKNHDLFDLSNLARLENFGYFKQAASLNNINATGIFINSGILDDSLGVIKALPYFSNVGLITQKLNDNFSFGVKELPIFVNGGSPIHSISSSWYADSAQTTLTGNYFALDYSFTPNIDAVAPNPLWYEASDLGSGCQMRIPIFKTYAACTESTYTNTFTAAISDDWHVPGNWSADQIPESCTKVIIPSSKKCKIYGNRKARAFDLKSETGSVLDIQNGVVLEVTPF